MPSRRVVVVFDPFLGSCGQVFDVGPGAGVDEFFLVGREERFGYRIVVTNPGPSQGSANTVTLAVRVELACGVGGAPVGMKDNAGGLTATLDGHVERVGDQLGAHVSGH